MMKNLSEGFAGANTASIKEHNEKQLKRLDVFTDDFSPPGTEDSAQGIDNKNKPFEDMRPINAEEHKAEIVDEIGQIMEARIKGKSSQFPGAKKEAAGDNAVFDPRSTDPGLVDQIPGGAGDDKKPSQFNIESLKKGMKVEMEHSKDKAIALEIAMDHLTEDPKYYDKLGEAGL